ncbi:hypothetical protein [Paenibacillus monticola]|uniref:Uncharacterized protein n=1 Tax=Paenibacillus monticola TaxID=2666075 RepID=A0A7X2H265_9BACL|nr:hypothetical protein [Paenibacillus monticola]MRN52005.1 hypothetical protein [Paenibacillus monticola]
MNELLGYITGDNIKWLLGVIIPMTVTVTGWIYVYKLGQKNVTRDKRIITYISAFNFIKDPLYNAIRKNSDFSTYLFITKTYLERLDKESILYRADLNHLLNSLNDKEFEKLKNVASSSYLEFSYAWEQYEIVFLPLVKQRHALQEEFKEIISVISDTYIQYTTFHYTLNQGIEFKVEQRSKLVESMKNTHDRLLDFFTCLMDVNVNMQNFVFKDLLNRSIEERKVLDERYLTINKLIEKHNVGNQ